VQRWHAPTHAPAPRTLLAARSLQQGKTHEGLHALLWPVSRLLVRYVEAHAVEFSGAHVLELGAGVVRSQSTTRCTATRITAQLAALRAAC
jgi:hypothetical protein